MISPEALRVGRQAVEQALCRLMCEIEMPLDRALAFTPRDLPEALDALVGQR
jgi:hypothetical protein